MEMSAAPGRQHPAVAVVNQRIERRAWQIPLKLFATVPIDETERCGAMSANAQCSHKSIGGLNMWELLKNLRQDESGQDLIEYALIAALIALGAIVSMRGVTTSIGDALASVGNQLTGAVGGN
jgi:pilus assembly protein Flp/PilA